MAHFGHKATRCANGGSSTFRGLTTRRYAVDAAVYGNLELRLNLGELTKADWGIFGLTDVGRVYLEGETSSRWHSAVGGGLWVAHSDKRQVLTATLAGSGEPIRLYVHAGFHFSTLGR